MVSDLKQLYTKDNLKIVVDYFSNEYQIFTAQKLAENFFKGNFSGIKPETVKEIKSKLTPRAFGGRRPQAQQNEAMRVKIIDGKVIVMDKEGK